MRKNKGLNPAHHEVRTILSDMLEPMYRSLPRAMDDVVRLRKREMELWFQRARAADAEQINKIALELKDVVAQAQVLEAEIERKRTCIRAFLMYVGQTVSRARREGEEPDFKPSLNAYQAKMLDEMAALEPGRYEVA